MRVSIVGTDTGAGKTWFACALVRALRDEGLRVAVCKPLESGTRIDGRDVAPADAVALREAAGSASPLSVVCPWPLPRAVAPAAEVERLGLALRVDDLVGAIDRAAIGADIVVVETAGGLRSPLLPDCTPLGLAQALGGITIVVAPDRLGTISHAVLALDALQGAMIPAFATVLSRRDSEGAAELDNAAWIARMGPPVSIYTIGSDGLAPAPLVSRIVALVRARAAE